MSTHFSKIGSVQKPSARPNEARASRLPSCINCPHHDSTFCKVVKANPAAFAKAFAQKKLLAGETLQTHHKQCECVGILKAGYLRYGYNEGGQDQDVVDFQRPGDLVGAQPWYRSGVQAVAATDCEICCFDKKSILAEIDENRELRRDIRAMTVEVHLRHKDRIAQRGALKCCERVAAFLVFAVDYMPTRVSRDGSTIVSIALSRKDWARYANTTVESVSREMSHLARVGLVNRIGDIEYRVSDVEQLREIAAL